MAEKPHVFLAISLIAAAVVFAPACASAQRTLEAVLGDEPPITPPPPIPTSPPQSSAGIGSPRQKREMEDFARQKEEAIRKQREFEVQSDKVAAEKNRAAADFERLMADDRINNRRVEEERRRAEADFYKLMKRNPDGQGVDLDRGSTVSPRGGSSDSPSRKVLGRRAD